jgi:hypothetical protein
MIINKLEKMEKIVSKNSNLAWVGWDVAERKRTEMGRTAVNGVRVNGQWYTQRVFKLDQHGWDIPNRYTM